jgi:catechol 2,3-dioxygenase-like lactoylglutathione lyase family enzyme
MTEVTLRPASPCFLVDDVFASAEYYRDILGFGFDNFYGDPPSFVIVSRDAARVMMKQAPAEAQPSARPNALAANGTADLFINVNDIRALAEELDTRGAEILEGPVYRPIYDGWEVLVRDLNGRMICFSQVD